MFGRASLQSRRRFSSSQLLPPSRQQRHTCLIAAENETKRRPSWQTQCISNHNRSYRTTRFIQQQQASSSSSSSSGPPPPHQQLLSDDTRYALLLAKRALQAACLVYCITEYVADITLCEGPSMHPTIQSQGEIVLVWKYIPGGLMDGCEGELRRKRAKQRQQDYERSTGTGLVDAAWRQPMIRVSDLPDNYSVVENIRQMLVAPLSVGDVVVVHHPHRPGNVCKRLVGLPGDCIIISGSGGLHVVPDGHVWLEGDNPGNSSDSRSYGSVPASLIVGRVPLRLWPLRGQAWMKRGLRPNQESANDNSSSGSNVLPAGYEGQRIVTKVEEKE
jgi:signal peptidase I